MGFLILKNNTYEGSHLYSSPILIQGSYFIGVILSEKVIDVIKIVFPSGTFKDTKYFDKRKTPMMLIECVAVLLGDYEPIRKRAANLLMKMIVSDHAYKEIVKLLESEVDVTDRRDPRVAKWRRKVIKRGRCERCGSTEKLEAHHYVHWSESPADRINVKNGVCLCHACHTEEHKGEQVYFLMLSRK